MTSTTDIDHRIFRFSTADLPERDRIAYWREHYGHVMLRVDLEPARDMAFEAYSKGLSLPGLQVMEASSSPAKISRRGQYLADGNDDIMLAINRTGSVVVESVGRVQSLREGDAIILSGGEAASFHRTSLGSSFTLRVPRTLLELDTGQCRRCGHASDSRRARGPQAAVGLYDLVPECRRFG